MARDVAQQVGGVVYREQYWNSRRAASGRCAARRAVRMAVVGRQWRHAGDVVAVRWTGHLRRPIAQHTGARLKVVRVLTDGRMRCLNKRLFAAPVASSRRQACYAVRSSALGRALSVGRGSHTCRRCQGFQVPRLSRHPSQLAIAGVEPCRKCAHHKP
jgi:hypothetical protein